MPAQDKDTKTRAGWTGALIHKVWDVVLGNIALSIVGAIGAIATVICVLFKRWALTDHTLTLPGWLWILLLLFYLILFSAGILLDVLGPLKYKAEADIKNRLSIYFRRVDPRRLDHAEYTLHYRRLDRKYRLKRGSAKRYLAEVSGEYGWDVIQPGPETLRVRYRPNAAEAAQQAEQEIIDRARNDVGRQLNDALG